MSMVYGSILAVTCDVGSVMIFTLDDNAGVFRKMLALKNVHFL
jgi:hypothetical protein